MPTPVFPGPASDDAKDLYLDLMKRCVSNVIYGDAEQRQVRPGSIFRRSLDKLFGLRRTPTLPFDLGRRSEGRDWPLTAHTMIGLKRLDNLQWCVEEALRNEVSGDLIEAGVWRGGASIFLRAILKVHGVRDRFVWVADSFASLPVPDPDEYPQDAGDRLNEYPQLAVSLDTVRSNFRRYGLLDEQVRFLEGWFRDTLPSSPIEDLAVVRLDCDMYGSTMDALVNLYPKLSPGGFLIVDDYGAVPGCRQAVDDYRSLQRISSPLITVDWTGVYWQRPDRD